jgi:hypothetical protein
VAEVLFEFPDVVLSSGGRTYWPRVVGAESDNGLWRARIEFVSSDGAVVTSGRETTQPNRQDTVYWATGLTPVYLEGALDRALNSHAGDVPEHVMAEPISASPVAHVDSIFNPFSAYRKGELMLRRQLQALSSWHLINIITAHGLSEQDPADLQAAAPEVLIELIVLQVQERLARASVR